MAKPLTLVASSALLTVQELDDDANIVDVRFTKSVIASKEAFTYEAAQRRKDDKCVRRVSLPCPRYMGN